MIFFKVAYENASTTATRAALVSIADVEECVNLRISHGEDAFLVAIRRRHTPKNVEKFAKLIQDKVWAVNNGAYCMASEVSFEYYDSHM